MGLSDKISFLGCSFVLCLGFGLAEYNYKGNCHNKLLGRSTYPMRVWASTHQLKPNPHSSQPLFGHVITAEVKGDKDIF